MLKAPQASLKQALKFKRFQKQNIVAFIKKYAIKNNDNETLRVSKARKAQHSSHVWSNISYATIKQDMKELNFLTKFLNLIQTNGLRIPIVHIPW